MNEHDTEQESSILELSGMHLAELLKYKKHSHDQNFSATAKFSRLNTARRHTQLSNNIAEALWGCKRILSKSGLIVQMIEVREWLANPETRQDLSKEWEEQLELIFSDPVFTKNKTIWFLFQSLLSAQQSFALECCQTRSHETFLTGELIGLLRGRCHEWSCVAKDFLMRGPSSIEVSSIDLSVGGYEQKTGGDLAFIFEIDDKNLSKCDLDDQAQVLAGQSKNIVVPIVFQAKRYTGDTADISQRHDTRGFQYDTLRQTQCASSYLFFENGEGRIEFPALPMVKPVTACRPINEAKNTHVFEQSMDFATYVLMALNGAEGIPIAGSREDALNMILANASPERLSTVAIIGNKANLADRYQEVYRTLLAEIAAQSQQDNTEQPE